MVGNKIAKGHGVRTCRQIKVDGIKLALHAPSPWQQKIVHVSDLLDNWGRRKLAYVIRKNTRGIFVYVKFIARAGVTAEIERNLRIADSVLRYQSNLLNPHVTEEVTVDPEEIKFAPVVPAEPEEELSFEQRLGLVPSAFRKPREEEDLLDPEEIDDVPDLNAEPAAAPRGES